MHFLQLWGPRRCAWWTDWRTLAQVPGPPPSDDKPPWGWRSAAAAIDRLSNWLTREDRGSVAHSSNDILSVFAKIICSFLYDWLDFKRINGNPVKMSHYLEWRDWSRDHFWDQNGLKMVSRPFWDQNVTLPRVTRLVSRPYLRPKWSQFWSRDQYRHQNVTLCSRHSQN